MKHNSILALLLSCLSLPVVLSAAPIQWTVASGGNGHYYEYFGFSIFEGISFGTSKSNAESSTFMGMNGYLLTITSEAENEFVRTSFPFIFGFGATSSVWLAASDVDVDGQFRWVSGPESGQLLTYNNFFPQGTTPGAGAPNYLAMIINAQAQDAPTTARWSAYNTTGDRALGYIVEYGAQSENNSAVPEPSSWALAAGALMALGAARSRWSRNFNL
jgi:hypothetical protein